MPDSEWPYKEKETDESVTITFEFLEVLNDIAGTHAMSVVGISKMEELAETLPAPRPDSSLWIGHGDPNDEGFAYQSWQIRTLKERLSPDGPVVRALGQQWVVMVASEWNDNFRPRIATAMGVEKNEVKDAAMADINRMRNDVIHHKGIATAKNTGRCELIPWFKPEDPIHVMPVHVSELMTYVGKTLPTTDIPGGPWQQRG
jgi:hypothetical protein